MEKAEEFLIKKGLYPNQVVFSDNDKFLIAELLSEFKDQKPNKKTGFWENLKKSMRIQG